MHKKNNPYIYLVYIGCISLMFTACVPKVTRKKATTDNIPQMFANGQDTTNSGRINRSIFFKDTLLVALIDTALKNNQQLNIIMQDINLANYQVRARKGQYLPFLNLFGGAGVEKVGRYTRFGANDATTNIRQNQATPDPLPDYLISANLSWQIDIWKQLRNAKKAAVYKYLSTVEGKNFAVTLLVAEIANNYYELVALDNQLEILKSNIDIQMNALRIVQLQKVAGAVTELAVRRFEAEVFKNQSRQYYIQQQIIECENRINFLLGRYSQPIQRNSAAFSDMVPPTIYSGIPSQLLQNRPDIKQTEMELAAADLDIKVAKANFYPRLDIMAGVGYNAFNPSYLITTPESMLWNVAGSLAVPVINRNAIKADYYSANARQVQAVYNYERTILNAYYEVANQVSNINNLEQSYHLKASQVEALTQSISTSIYLFKSAQADYMEVLLIQRDALESRMELIETKKQQINAVVNIYQALGGGW